VNEAVQALLFCYGTLRDPEVRRSVFGRSLDGEADALRGHEFGTVVIDGTAYRTLVASDRPDALVEGLVLQLLDGDLARVDAYEGSTDYRRVSVRLESGRLAFVYVSAGA
jgi:gamma-glutamylcyclotransferase (GGCT)/AIG2-like uncharacterized protein YtfP